MASIKLNYGRSHFYLEFDPERFQVLEPATASESLSDFQLNEKLSEPLGSLAVEEITGPGDKVLIVVPDATREVGAGQVANLLVRRLIANGTAPFDISIIFATGIHRLATEDEKRAVVTPFIYQRVKLLDHRPRDIARIIRLGETATGIPIELNRALFENDRIFLIGGIAFHYFAGFTGGRKLICPGLASSRTVSATHRLAFDCENLTRRSGVGPGRLDGNPVHEAFAEIAGRVANVFCISTIVNDAGEVTDLYCGEMNASHRAGCDAFAKGHTAAAPGKRALVVASCGGLPYDINMIQAHKTLEAVSHACAEGGTIVLLAQCRDGLGRDDFLKWFDAANSRELAARLCEAYQVNGQTAWSLLTLAERFDVRVVTDIYQTRTEKMRLKWHGSLADALKGLEGRKGYIIPGGARIRVTEQMR